MPPTLLLSFSSKFKAAQLSRDELPKDLPSAVQILVTPPQLERLAAAMEYEGPLAKGYIAFCLCRLELEPAPKPEL
jgi:hypothetical protein